MNSTPLLTLRRLATLALLVALPLSTAQAAQAHWIGSWSTAVYASEQGPGDNITLRQPLHLSAGGRQLRIRISNEYGKAPLVIGAATLASTDGRDRINVDQLRTLRFSGDASIRIPPGAYVYSDPVTLTVPIGGDVSVSLYLPAQQQDGITRHGSAYQSVFVAPGNQVAAPQLKTVSVLGSFFYLSGVDVQAGPGATTIVAFGDSITDGKDSTPDANRRWPDFLARRLNADATHAETGVLNQGIGGNRLVNEGTADAALTRFDRDVLSHPGVSHVITLIGINDFGRFGRGPTAVDEITVADMKAAYLQMLQRAHDHGIKLIVGTLLPFKDAFYYTDKGEQMRGELNDWLRHCGLFDGVVDFDAALRDPRHPLSLQGSYDSGDHLHPSDAGMKAMADAVNLALLR